MKAITTRSALFILVSSLTLLASGCGGSSKAPSDEAVKAAVTKVIPAHVKLEAVELEPVGDGLFNVKAVVSAREILYVRAPDANVPFPLIRPVQQEGEKVTGYGKLLAEHLVDTWKIHEVQLTEGIQALGKPRGSFAGAYVAGSAEADQAVAQFKANAEKAAKEAAEREAAQRKQAAEIEAARRKEAAQLAEKQKREAAELAARQQQEALAEAARQEAEKKVIKERLLAAFGAGKRYTGVLTSGGARQRIDMRVVEQSGFLVTCEFSNPDEPGYRVTWKGEIAVDPGSGEYPVNVSPIDRVERNNVWKFYNASWSGSLKLRVQPDGEITGEGARYDSFTIRLQPVSS